MIQINKQKDKIVLTLTAELDYEDVQDLVLDLQSWLIENDPLPKFKGISEDKVKEAWEYSNQKREEARLQNESKNKLAEDMRRCFVDLLDVEAIKKELHVYELDPISKEVIVKSKKLNEKR